MARLDMALQLALLHPGICRSSRGTSLNSQNNTQSLTVIPSLNARV